MNPNGDQQQTHHNTASPFVAFDTWCVRCGYNLRRLPNTANCPACAIPVADTLHSNLIANASTDYAERLRKGLTFILNSILVSIALGVLLFIVVMIYTVANGSSTPPPPNTPFQPTPMPLWWTISFGLTMFVCHAFQMYGLWLFTTNDPQFSGRYSASATRTWIRHLIVITVTLTVVQYIVQLFTTHLGITIAFGILGLAIWIPMGCLQMTYICWLAPRLPDARVAERAKLMIWLYPVLNTVGILALGLGPLIALVMYWNLLNWIRKDLKYLLDLQAYEDANNAANTQQR